MSALCRQSFMVVCVLHHNPPTNWPTRCRLRKLPPAMAIKPIYHVCKAAEWEAAGRGGRYAGSSQDKADGFIHFSTAEQVVASAAKHRAGQHDLVILEADAAALGPALRWEPSRGGQLFPHLYGPLPVKAVSRAAPLPLGADGHHVFPWGLR
jgi:uncharacterized protein (DUF952 family)